MKSQQNKRKGSNRILLVEDEAIVGSDIKQLLEYRGFFVSDVFPTGEEALKKIDSFKPDLVLLDIKLAGRMDGIETARAIQGEYDVPVVYLTAMGDEQTFQRAKSTGPFGYIYKPAEDKDLVTTVETALYKHHIQKELSASEQKFRNLFELSKEAIYISTKKRYIQDANPAFLEMFGYSSDELKKYDVKGLYKDPDDREKIQRKIESKGFIKDYPVSLKTKSGSLMDCLITATIWRDASGKISGYQGFIRDITEQKRIQEKLKESERKYRALFEYSNDAVFLMSPEGLQIDFNQKAADLLGYTREELKGKRFRDLIAESEQKNAFGKLEEIKKKKSIPVYKRTIIKKDGTTVPVEVNLSLISDSKGNPLFIQSIVRDVSQKH
ncbi:MAG: PAS domain S-box protein [Candidatus Aminicenantes bacterium]|nr:PAS domain S-box protein [Candidatus Aminicenantes bacterium]